MFTSTCLWFTDPSPSARLSKFLSNSTDTPDPNSLAWLSIEVDQLPWLPCFQVVCTWINCNCIIGRTFINRTPTVKALSSRNHRPCTAPLFQKQPRIYWTSILTPLVPRLAQSIQTASHWHRVYRQPHSLLTIARTHLVLSISHSHIRTQREREHIGEQYLSTDPRDKRELLEWLLVLQIFKLSYSCSSSLLSTVLSINHLHMCWHGKYPLCMNCYIYIH
jgi:hypothetical protein